MRVFGVFHSYGTVLAAMFAVRKGLKVLDSIIRLDFIDVMHILIWTKRAIMLFPCNAVLPNIAILIRLRVIWHEQQHIALATNRAATIPVGMRRASLKSGPAVTFDIGHGMAGKVSSIPFGLPSSDLCWSSASTLADSRWYFFGLGDISSVSHAVHSPIVNGIGQARQMFTRLFGPFCILTRIQLGGSTT